mmetsp:Transcript_74008/g.176152  ORF Transcript_74008/g.176152 Transcript_74008/m.176152 type:complete len:423 (+) Transcript_74008:61-1329(+)
MRMMLLSLLALGCLARSQADELPRGHLDLCLPTAEETHQQVGRRALLQIAAAASAEAFFPALGTCDPRALNGKCGESRASFIAGLEALASHKNASRQPWFGDGAELIQQMRMMWEKSTQNKHFNITNMPIPNEAYSTFENLRKVDARQVLAFRETWTDEDTELLKLIDGKPDVFVKGNLTTEKMRSTLPSISVLLNLIERGSIAIVGGGRSVAGHGKEIDSAAVVVRFNDHLEKEMKKEDTGLRMDVHVLNNMVEFNETQEADVLHIDLESTYVGATVCNRWRWQSDESPDYTKVTLTMRPSAFCALPGIEHHTRGFLFYWLVGRLFERVSMYGMSEDDRIFHFGRSPVISEKFLPFEHFLYKTARTMQSAAQQARLQEAANKTASNGKAPIMAQVAEMERPSWAIAESENYDHLAMYPWPE